MEQNIVVVDAGQLENIVKKALNEALAIQRKSEASIKSTETFVNRKEAAEFLDISLPTLSRHTKDGIIPSYRIGSRILYKLSEIEGHIRACKFK